MHEQLSGLNELSSRMRHSNPAIWRHGPNANLIEEAENLTDHCQVLVAFSGAGTFKWVSIDSRYLRLLFHTAVTEEITEVPVSLGLMFAAGRGETCAD